MRHRYMCTRVHVVLKNLFGNVYFVLFIFNIHGREKRYSATSESAIKEKSIFGLFEFIFLTYFLFLGRGGFFC